MAITQTYYSRHFPSLAGQIVSCILGAIAYTSSKKYGHHATISTILWFTSNNLQIANALLDPGFACLRRTKKDPDGTTVETRKPLIGFKSCERVEVEDDEKPDGDGKSDGDERLDGDKKSNGGIKVGHERAFIRL